jgi:hypothetical protein
VSETDKKVYYSKSFFSPIGKSGKPLSKVIAPMDNTGFRSNPGNPLLVFEHEQECVESWNRQIKEHLVQVDKLIEGATAHWKTERFNMSAMMVEVTDGP